ncbi:hypothetical protein [Marinagarivorans algicola]|uniref:hypothetical protein n=1 Tax=Marinagarivorans algicola TaxID=1513270 RepID=UPI0006B52AAB|nr:hypothetical protein [Marinagarivorans algicola]
MISYCFAGGASRLQPLSTKFVLLCVLLISLPLSAQTGSGFELLAGVAFEDVTNANREAEPTRMIDEYQWRPSLTANGVLVGSLMRLEIDGSYEMRRFSEQKVQDHELFLGDLTWFLGSSTSRFMADISHRSAELLIDPSQGDAPDNLDRRNSTSATGWLRLGSPQSQWLLDINTSKVAFDLAQASNSHRQGGGIRYDRGISPISRFGVELSGYQLKYDNTTDQLMVPVAEQISQETFNYSRAALSWSTSLERLQYSLSIGRNKTDGGSGSALYDIQIEYLGDTHELSTAFRQWITDTSQGAGAQALTSEGGELDGRVGVLDQYKRRDGHVEWLYRALCSRCALAVTLGAQREDYQQATQFDSTELFGHLQLNYRQSRHGYLNTSYRVIEVDFTHTQGDYDEALWRVEVGLNSLVRHGTLRFYAQHADRRNHHDGAANNYSRGLIGVAFDYVLYRR